MSAAESTTRFADLKDLFRRLRCNWRWVAAQYIGTALLILIALAWTRLSEKHWGQVALSLLLPVLLAISALELEAGTMRILADDDGKRVKLVWGALSLLVWIALVWACWWVLNWCDDQIPAWAGYLNSQASAHQRVTIFSYEHIYLWMLKVDWVLRWIVVPAKVIPFASATAQWGWRLPWRRIFRLLRNWRWWLAVTIAAFAAIWIPGKLFAADPSGTVSAQIWHVGLKLALAYLLAVGSWVLLLGWVGVLFGCSEPTAEAETK